MERITSNYTDKPFIVILITVDINTIFIINSYVITTSYSRNSTKLSWDCDINIRPSNNGSDILDAGTMPTGF